MDENGNLENNDVSPIDQLKQGVSKSVDSILGDKVIMQNTEYRDPFNLYNAYNTIGDVNDQFEIQSQDVRNDIIKGYIEPARIKNRELINQTTDDQWLFGKTQKDLALLGNDIDLGIVAPAYVKLGTGAVEGVSLAAGTIGQIGVGLGLMGTVNIQDLIAGRTIEKEVGIKQSGPLPIPIGSTVAKNIGLSIGGGSVPGTKKTEVDTVIGETTYTKLENGDTLISTPVTTTETTTEKVVPNILENLIGQGGSVAGEFSNDPFTSAGKYGIPLLIGGKSFGKIGKAKISETPIMTKTVKGSEVLGDARELSYDPITGNYDFTAKTSNMFVGQKSSGRILKASEYGYSYDPLSGIGKTGEVLIGAGKTIGSTVIKTGNKYVGETGIRVGAGTGSELIIDKYATPKDIKTINKNVDINEIILPSNKNVNPNKITEDSDS
jgi:hypothetical protein